MDVIRQTKHLGELASVKCTMCVG